MRFSTQIGEFAPYTRIPGTYVEAAVPPLCRRKVQSHDHVHGESCTVHRTVHFHMLPLSSLSQHLSFSSHNLLSLPHLSLFISSLLSLTPTLSSSPSPALSLSFSPTPSLSLFHGLYSSLTHSLPSLLSLQDGIPLLMGMVINFPNNLLGIHCTALH